MVVYKMLSTHLNSLPYTKFVLIEDVVTAKSVEILEHLLKNHEKKTEYRTHYFVFERGFKRINEKHVKSICHDFTSDVRSWVNKEPCDLRAELGNISENCVIVVDSLAHVLYRYGLLETYRIFNEIKNKTCVQQIICVLHIDMLEEKEKIIKYFQHLATLYMELNSKRISYTYKKSQRKIIKQIEQYHFENGIFFTEAVKKPDDKIIKETVGQILPENLSTFKISLSDNEKESRENLVLPYLPKNEKTEPKIHYVFDEIDDWDEEDPDDDLDI